MKVKLDDLSINVSNLFNIVGEEKFLEITKLYGGNNLYIPTYKSAIRESRNREIINKYNGCNADVLAREYGISVNYVNKIVKR